jgi:eukaryotic-like serine/threonine-protein kinase
MALNIGTRLGPYEIQSIIGAGGMGEVYRANDTRLSRIVAIKVLPVHLSADSALRQRFEREARTISSLSHPNICALYDMGNQDGIEFLVMEYLEGETLSDRLKRGALPKDQLLRCGIQIAEALDEAHRRGVVHRDLKPANIMLTKSGVKLLDFGLAKLNTSELLTPSSNVSILPTEAGLQNLTTEGTILGTFHYMAPEQLEGKGTDARSDIFALGTVLYEMATGRRPFTGQSQAALISAVLSSDPASISTPQSMIPPALDHVVKKALAKNPVDRWQTARDVATELKWVLEGGSQMTAAFVRKKRFRRESIVFPILSAILLLITIALIFALYRSSYRLKEERPVKLFVLPPPKAMATDALAISGDSRNLAFVATGPDGGKSLWMRSLDSSTPEQLSGTEDATYPFWSPDNRFIAFFTQNRLKKMEIRGGPPQVLCDVSGARGGTWNRDGLILISPTFTAGLYRMPAAGGSLTPLTTLDSSRQETSHRWPWFLPDGHHFLYVVLSADRKNCGIFVSSIDNPKQKQQLLTDFSAAQYVTPGYLIFTRGTTLMAQAFDVDRLQLKGEPFSLRETVGYDGYTAYALFSVSENNMLTYGNTDELKTRLVWTDRSGKQINLLGEPGRYVEPRLSPDEKKLVLARIDPDTTNYDLWIVELLRGTFTRFTFDPSNEVSPIWSPDGEWIAYCSNPRGSVNIFRKASSGNGSDQLLVDSANPKYPTDWSQDGKYILYDEIDPKAKFDIWTLPLSGNRNPMPFLQTRFNESHGQFSPDGKWVAYSSDETGRAEIYIRSFPATAEGKLQISTNGGDQAQWRRDGKELFYVAADNRLMAVQIQTEPSLVAGVPSPLFTARVPPNSMTDARNQYVLTADGRRFLVNALATDSSASPITVVLNWTFLLRH